MTLHIYNVFLGYNGVDVGEKLQERYCRDVVVISEDGMEAIKMATPIACEAHPLDQKVELLGTAASNERKRIVIVKGWFI